MMYTKVYVVYNSNWEKKKKNFEGFLWWQSKQMLIFWPSKESNNAQETLSGFTFYFE